MNPTEASLKVAKLLSAMDALSVLDLHPVTSAADIETMRANAEAITRDILGYLLASENFVPVTEAPDAVQEWDL